MDNINMAIIRLKFYFIIIIIIAYGRADNNTVSLRYIGRGRTGVRAVDCCVLWSIVLASDEPEVVVPRVMRFVQMTNSPRESREDRVENNTQPKSCIAD